MKNNTLEELHHYCNEFLNIGQFKDYCPNGLQIQAPLDKKISRLAVAVTASQYVIEQAIQYNADALLVHHGYFWNNESRSLTGILYQRVQKLIQAEIPLLAYHLPLDAHETVGNNQQLAKKLGFLNTGYHQNDILLRLGKTQQPITLNSLTQKITSTLNRTPTVIIPRQWEQQENTIINHVAWCTGGADGYFKQFSSDVTQLYITGEISESCYHLAHELNIAFIAAGHHATERYGVIALAEHLQHIYATDLQQELAIHFIDEENPC
jgi:dinuclear metal center YbgI/SA1388 family protein